MCSFTGRIRIKLIIRWPMRIIPLVALLFVSPLAVAQAAPPPAAVTAADTQAAQKTVKALVNAIRYRKDALAAGKLGFEPMAKLLLQDAWQNATAAQRTDFVRGLTTLVTRTSFPKGREMFQYLDALLFESVAPVGDTLHVKSVVVVHRNLKKVEIPIEWVLGRAAAGFQVVDIISFNESIAEGIREEEVLPLLKDGGMPHVLEALQKRVAELPAEAP
jgi:ABC-type transporter MlaC component